jgi:hypothetical protein
MRRTDVLDGPRPRYWECTICTARAPDAVFTVRTYATGRHDRTHPIGACPPTIETRGPAGSFVAAAGEQGRERAHRAAAEYVAVIASNEAVRVVQAALSEGIAASPSS